MIVDAVSCIPTPYNQAFFTSLSQQVDLRVHYQSEANRVRGWERIGTDFREGHENIVHRGVRTHFLGWWSPDCAGRFGKMPTSSSWETAITHRR